MALSPDLTRLLPSSLDVLRYMGQQSIESASADALAEGAGMSERRIGKAIRALVTRGYLNMDENYVYFLSNKGISAIQELAEHDALESASTNTQQTATIQSQLVAVVPAALPQGGGNVQIGFSDAPPVSTQLILRLSALGAQTNPAELTFSLNPGQSAPPVNVTITPSGEYKATRIRIEAIQMLGETDVHPAGGMFFDIPVGDTGGNPMAWYGSVELQG